MLENCEDAGGHRSGTGQRTSISSKLPNGGPECTPACAAMIERRLAVLRWDRLPAHATASESWEAFHSRCQVPGSGFRTWRFDGVAVRETKQLAFSVQRRGKTTLKLARHLESRTGTTWAAVSHSAQLACTSTTDTS